MAQNHFSIHMYKYRKIETTNRKQKMASNTINTNIEFDGIFGEPLYNNEGIDSLTVDVQFSAEYAAVQLENVMPFTVIMDEQFEYMREELAAMPLFKFKEKFQDSFYYNKIQSLRRKEQKRKNTQLHRLIDRRDNLIREKLQLIEEINCLYTWDYANNEEF